VRDADHRQHDEQAVMLSALLDILSVLRDDVRAFHNEGGPG
jgi:hypothetical protein